VRRLAAVVVGGLLVTGCSAIGDYFSGKDNTTPPAELVALKPTLAIERVWSAGGGAGEEDLPARLAPVLDAGNLYYADRKGRVSAYDPDTGATHWSVELEAPVAGGPGAGEGVVLVGTRDARVIALREDSGAQLWRARVTSEVLAAPLAAEGVAVVHTVDGRVTGLDLADGRQKWVYDRSVPVLTLRGVGNPVAARGLAIVGLASGKLVGLGLRDGNPHWEAQIVVPSGRSELERIVDLDAIPLVVGDVVYAAAYQGNLAAVAIDNGRILMRREFSSYSGMAVERRTLYITDAEDHVWALDRYTGASLWQQDKLHNRRLTAPAVTGDAVVVGDLEGYVHWLAREDGHLLARERVANAAITGAPLAIGGTVYVGAEDGSITALRVKPPAADASS